MKHTSHDKRGFTIVEILIVIVVIGILAAIVIVAFNGVQSRARNTARISEIKSWVKSFELYKADVGKGAAPVMADGNYCLGTGFPVGAGGVNRCWVYQDGTYGYKESDNAALMTEIKKVSTLPSGKRTIVAGSYVGPMVTYGATSIIIYAVLEGNNVASECPSGTTFQDFGISNFTSCYVTISKL